MSGSDCAETLDSRVDDLRLGDVVGVVDIGSDQGKDDGELGLPLEKVRLILQLTSQSFHGPAPAMFLDMLHVLQEIQIRVLVIQVSIGMLHM